MRLDTSIAAVALAAVALAAGALLALTLGGNLANAAEPAEVVFIHGNIHTVDERQPRAEAVAVKDGKIVFVGSNKEAEAYRGPATRVVDFRGRTVLPGLTDSHAHLAGIGERETALNLEGTASLDIFLAKVKQRVERAGPGEWIVGRGWIETPWKPPAFPTRGDLDRISPKNPVSLVRADGHGMVANSAALKLAGIDRTTENPFGGEIMKDRATGEPNGMLLDKAMGLVWKVVPESARGNREQAILAGAKRCLEMGWCQIQDAGGPHADVELMRKLYREGKLKLRVYKAISGPGADAKKLLAEGPSAGEFDDRFTLRSIKVVLDGALGSKGAALLEKYADHDTSGFLIHTEDQLLPLLTEALRKGIQVETHAIGDRANRVVLDLYEKAFKEVPAAQRLVPDPRWRVEHAQHLHSAEIPRFAALGVIPSMQPSHAIGDLHFAHRRLGIERLAGAYAWKSLIESGAMIAGGSDAPVEQGSPLIEFYAAVTRKDLRGFSGEGWHPEQAVSRERALAMFTIWAARAAFEEKLRGSIEVGKLADFTVLSADIMKIPAAEILKAQVEMTVIGGEVVYERSKKD